MTMIMIIALRAERAEHFCFCTPLVTFWGTLIANDVNKIKYICWNVGLRQASSRVTIHYNALGKCSMFGCNNLPQEYFDAFRDMLMMLYISKTFSRLVWSTFTDVFSRNKINGCYKILFRIYFISLTQRNLTRKVSLGAAARRPHHYATANTLLTIMLLTVGIQTRISWYKKNGTRKN